MFLREFIPVVPYIGPFTALQSRSDDITCLVFWLYNTTMWLHLMECDKSISEVCEMLGSFGMIGEVIKSVFGTHGLSRTFRGLKAIQSLS